VIEVLDLTKRYRNATAVNGLSFRVADGRVTAFLGPNGAGKTTTLRVLLGLVRPTSGRATIDAKQYRDLDDPARHVGAVLEASNYHPKRSGRSHLRVLCTAAGLPWSRADELLEFVGIGDAAGRAVGGYSLGMRQRLSVAAALLGDPQLLVLDEPANGLDPEGIRWLRDFLRGFVGDGGTAFISSHVLAEVQQVADDVVIIHRGKLVAHENVDALTARAAGATRVRSPEAERLQKAIVADGGEARVEADALTTTVPARRVGEIAAAQGVVLHELRTESAALEDVFLELTSGEGGPS
jgi:ABC-2 type transport system ATP-binding protein